MTNYWDHRFLKHLEMNDIKTIFEIGARYGSESIQLKKTFVKSIVHSFECNPKTIDTCAKNLSTHDGIIFNNFGLGENKEKLPFYSYIKNNPGASSLLKRIDFDRTQILSGVIEIETLKNYVDNNNIQNIDILCMDVQGYELNVLKGAGCFIKNINYIIMEEPKPIINTKFLPENVHSKYINAPSSQEIKMFMNQNNFVEIERIPENSIEDNVMYKNTLLNVS